MKRIAVILLVGMVNFLNGQTGYWQQHAKYNMDIDFDVKTHQFSGSQSIVYTNNSPDTLNVVFYHLYFNAFQPGSMMDERSRTILDPDPRVGERIAKLSEDEMGYQKVVQLRQDGKAVKYEMEGTILEVVLDHPILPGEQTTLDMRFEAQVPIQIRRSGRDNAENVAYSMTQWYPKLAEYDYMGWHANPYIGREYHGIWGDFYVNINIDSRYMMGATGVLENANEIGRGYQDANKLQLIPNTEKVVWKWKAENVIDFAWAADPDYKHIKKTAHDGTVMHFLYKPETAKEENWKLLPDIMDEALKYMNKTFGKYAFPQYTFIQGGDGGMEYPMITLITGNRSLSSLVGVSVHEWMHSWYQFMLATNESLYPWLDEGFTSFATSEVMNYLIQQGKLPGEYRENPHTGSVMGYVMFSQSGMEEALSTHADHYNTNTAYGRGSYTKGSVFLSQLEYIIGKQPFRKGLLRYFNEWKFKHPTPNAIIRSMEKESGLELDWFKEYFVYTTKKIDYGVDSVFMKDGTTTIRLQREDMMPMPVELEIEYVDGTKELHYIPLRIMRGKKDFGGQKVFIHPDWPWTHRNYEFQLNKNLNQVKSIMLNPNSEMADQNKDNNLLELN